MITLKHRRPSWRPLALAAIAAATASVALVSTASAAAAGGGQVSAGLGLPVGAMVSLGPISVLDGNVTVSGTVDPNAVLGVDTTVGVPGVAAKVGAPATPGAQTPTSVRAGLSAAANVKLTVNDQPVALDDKGSFTATVAVGEQPAVRVQATSLATGEVFVTTIPIVAIPSGGTPVDALAKLDAAGVTLLLPPDGLTSVDGQPVLVNMNVQDAKPLAGLTIDGADLLAGSPTSSSPSSGSDMRSASKTGTSKTTSKTSLETRASVTHTASGGLIVVQPVSSSSHEVEITVKDVYGVTQVSTFPLKQVTSVIRIGRMSSVSAAGAQGVRISTLHFMTNRVRSHHRLRLQVTLRDRHDYFVRDAVVLVRGLAHRTSISGQFAAITNSRGIATLTMPVTAHALGKRLYLQVVARTPTASARVKASTLLPGALAA